MNKEIFNQHLSKHVAEIQKDIEDEKSFLNKQKRNLDYIKESCKESQEKIDSLHEIINIIKKSRSDNG
jgi:hypothetical protein